MNPARQQQREDAFRAIFERGTIAMGGGAAGADRFNEVLEYIKGHEKMVVARRAVFRSAVDVARFKRNIQHGPDAAPDDPIGRARFHLRRTAEEALPSAEQHLTRLREEYRSAVNTHVRALVRELSESRAKVPTSDTFCEIVQSAIYHHQLLAIDELVLVPYVPADLGGNSTALLGLNELYDDPVSVDTSDTYLSGKVMDLASRWTTVRVLRKGDAGQSLADFPKEPEEYLGVNTRELWALCDELTPGAGSRRKSRGFKALRSLASDQKIRVQERELAEIREAQLEETGEVQADVVDITTPPAVGSEFAV